MFVDGCFWHACSEHGTAPTSNAGWWRTKLERNVERDRDTDARLLELCWIPLRFWEHADMEAAADIVEEQWRSRR